MHESVFEVLEKDNAQILTLFRQLQGSDSDEPERRRGLLNALNRALAAHERATEATIVPIVLDASLPPDGLDAWRGVNREIDAFFDDLGHIAPHDEQFDRDCRILHERVMERIHLEERSLHPVAWRQLPGDDGRAWELAERARAELT